MSSLDANKSLIENSDYLKRLASELKSKKIEDIDSNLLYEVAYADTYLDVLLSKSNSTTLNSELLDSKSVFDSILASAPYDKVNKLKSGFDYKKLLRCKYDDVDKASYEKKYVVSGEGNALGAYFRNTSPSLIVITIIFSFVMFGGIDFLSKVLWGDNSAMSQLSTSAAEVLSSYMKIIKLFLSFCCMLMFMVKSLGMALDIMYIAFPFMRVMLPDDKQRMLVSSDAIKSVECCLGETVVYKKVKDFNRIERNKVWLDTMLEVLEHYNSEEGVSSVYGNIVNKNEVLNTLKDTKEKLNLLESSGRKRKEYYLLMAKIEFLHDKYLQLV